MNLHTVKKIYEKMADERSRQIFVNRLLYSITGSPSYLQNVIRTSRKGELFITELEQASGGRVLFGTGIWGREIFQAFPDAGWTFWTDSNPQKEVLYHMPVVPFAEFVQSYNGESVVVTSRLYYRQMTEQLLHAGVPSEKIINAGQLLDGFLSEQYFDLEALPHAQGKEIFVDAGSFDGMSSVSFKRWAKDSMFVYAFEPDICNAKRCLQNLVKNQIPSKVIRKGLWNKNTRLQFETKATALSKICARGGVTVPVVPLDEILREDPVTFIKMDIEGAEKEALEGAERTITQYQPKLAISVYHKPEDILELPERILSYDPGYQLYMRHYSLAAFDTVLYAVPDS